jgi:hypothetical protein
LCAGTVSSDLSGESMQHDQAENRTRASSRSDQKRRSCFDVAAVVEHRHSMKKRRARDSVTSVIHQGISSSLTSSDSSPQRSLVSIPVEAPCSTPWNSCFTHEQGFDAGLVMGQTSALQFMSHVHTTNRCVEEGVADCDHEDDETDTEEDCEDGNGLVMAKASSVDGDAEISSTICTDPCHAVRLETSMMSPVERIQLFRQQMSGNVVIPDTWSGEEKLKDWARHGTVEDALRPLGLMMATASLANDSLSKRATSSRLPGPASIAPVVLSQLR